MNVVQLPNWRAKKGMNMNISLLWKMKESEFCGIEMFNVMEARRPFLIVIEKEGSMNKAVPGNKRLLDKNKENVDKYQDLKHEIARLWESSKVDVVHVVVGALCMVTNQFQNRIGELGITIKTEML